MGNLSAGDRIIDRTYSYNTDDMVATLVAHPGIFDESAQDDNTFYKITIPKLMEQKLTKIKYYFL